MTKILLDLDLGINLKAIRKSLEMTQEDVCTQLALLGRPMSQSTYAQIETGKRNIYLSDLIALQIIFNTSYDELFRDLVPINKYDINGEL